MNPLLKGDRYTVSPCMGNYPPLDDGVRYDREKADTEAKSEAPASATNLARAVEADQPGLLHA